MRTIFNVVYKKLRGTESHFDDQIPTSTLIKTAIMQTFRLIRGMLVLHKFVFVSPGFKVSHKRKIKLGKFVSVGRNVEINALSTHGVIFGQKVTVDDFAVIRGSGVMAQLGYGVQVGDNSSIGYRNFLNGVGGISIGSNCLLGPDVRIFSGNHEFDQTSLPIRQQGEKLDPVSIGDDVWIGANVTVLAGVTIGDGAVVAAGAVVTKNILDFEIYAGVPAKKIGYRGERHGT